MKKTVSSLLDKLTDLIIKKPKTIFVVLVVSSIVPMLYLPQLVVDTSPQAFFHQDDPILLKYDQFLDQYERDEVAVLLLEHDNIFSNQFLQVLKNIHQDLESTTPFVEEVASLINTTSIKGRNNELVVKDLLDDWPQSEQAFSDLRQDVLSHPLYPNLLISKDARYTTIVVRSLAFNSETKNSVDELLDGFESTQEESQRTDFKKLDAKQLNKFNESILDLVKKYQTPDTKIYTGGLSLSNHEIIVGLNKEIPLFTGLAILLIALFLYLLFGRISGVVIPITLVCTALLSTLGIMTFFQVPFTVFTQVLPSFLLAVGVGDSVHLLSIFYRRYSETEDKLNSLRFAINHTGLAMFMTSITTAAGLLSFAVSEIAAVGNLGIFGALGVMLAFVYSILLLPTLIVLLPLRSEASHKGGTHRIIEDSISRISVFATRHSGKVILASAVLAIIATIGVSKLRIHYDAISWLPKGNPVRVASEVLDREMHGAMFVEIVLDTGVAGGVKQPEFLNQLEALQHKISNMTGEEDMYVGKTIAITDILKLIHQALNENNPAFHQIPQNPDLIAQELLLFENSGSDDLRAVVDSQYQETRLTVKLPWTSAGAYALFLADMRSVIESHFSSKPSFTITGMITLLTETTTHAIKSMIQSYSIAAVTIGIMMILLLQSVRVGLIAMIPNLFPILIALGFMGLLGFPLDLASILVGSIAIGLSVDDTIHFMHHFKRYFTESGDVVKAVDNTLHTSGRAMLVTTIVLSIGFFIFALSDMKNLISFGLITGIATIMALLADIILAPALMAFAVKNRSVCRCLER